MAMPTDVPIIDCMIGFPMEDKKATYEFIVKGTTLTGTAKGSLTGEGKISDGKINGDTFTFVENTTYMGMPLAFNYTGKMTSGDTIELSRTLMEFEAEKATAKRAK